MNYKRILILVVAMFMLSIGFVYEASAQRRGRSVTVRRPVIVRHYGYRDPFWRSRYYGYYDPYFNSPYLRHQEQQYYLQSDLAGNRRELAEHRRKYQADGVITEKERRELEDDVKDVRNSTQRLRKFNRYY